MMRKAANPRVSVEGSALRRVRQCKGIGLALALAGGIAACDPGIAPGTIGHVQGFAGIAASDEPQSVLVARDILSSGGTAADAAIAMYFAMSVTLPSRAGLGGYGACLVHQPKDRIRKWEPLDEALLFIPQSPAAAAVPRGLFALHAKYGRLRWEALVGPAEGMARLGAPVSRALASDIALAGQGLQSEADMRRIFLKSDGNLAGEGDVIRNVGLASFIARLRARGPADLYSGQLAKEMSASAAEIGIALTPEEMRNVKVPFTATHWVRFGNLTAHFPTSDGGGDLSRMWKQIVDKQTAEPPASSEPSSGAGFMVADRDGQAVVCATSMGSLFGARKMVPNVGILMVSGPAPKAGLAPMMVVAHNVTEFRYALTSAGGASGASGLMTAAAKATIDEQPLAQSVRLAAGRRVLAIGCSKGLPPSPESCQVGVDPEGFGYGMGVGLKTKD